MYIDVKIPQDKQLEIQQKFNEFIVKEMTDELLEQCFKESLKGQIKNVIQNMFQDKSFREKLTQKIIPIIVNFESESNNASN